MKKKLLLASALLLMFPMVAFADDSTVESTATSTATVGFTADEPTKPVDPLDPTDPETPLDPKEEGTGNVGKLTVDYVPKLQFGNVKIDRTEKVVKSTSMLPYVQVTDVRGTAEGWNLQASLGKFTNADNTHTIDNAMITLSNGKVDTNDTKKTNAPVANQKIELNSSTSTPVDVMTATSGNGMGTWITTWLGTTGQTTNDNVTLKLDTRDARVGNYSSDITWNLIQTP